MIKIAYIKEQNIPSCHTYRVLLYGKCIGEVYEIDYKPRGRYFVSLNDNNVLSGKVFSLASARSAISAIYKHVKR